MRKSNVLSLPLQLVFPGETDLYGLAWTNFSSQDYMITMLHWLSIYTTMKHSILQILKKRACISPFRLPV
jgi:hypothetical protein